MLNWLYFLHSDLAILIIFVASTCLSAYLLASCLRWLPYFATRPNFEEAWLFAAKTSLVTLATVVLGFSLIVVLTHFNRVETHVAREATQIEELDRLSRMYGGAREQPMRRALLAYAESIAQDEWPLLAYGRSSLRTTQLFEAVAQIANELAPTDVRQSQLYAEMIKDLSALVEARSDRIASAHAGLHPIFWMVNVLILFCIIVVSAIASIRGGGIRVLVLHFQLACLAGLVALVFVVDQPFKGQTSISAEPIRIVVKSIALRAGSQ